MTTRKIDYPCLRCKEHVTKNSESIQCSLCELWVHKKCEKMSDETFKVLCGAVKEGLGMYWACTACTSYSAKFNKSIQELGRRVTKVEEQMKERVIEIDNVKKEIDVVKTQVDSMNRRVDEGRENQNSSVFREIRERENRKTNIVFHNIPEPKGKSKEDRIKEDDTQVEELCKVIGAPIIMKGTAKFTARLGKFSKDGCRPLLVGYKDKETKEKILDNARNLSKQEEGSQWKSVSIVPDLTQIQRKEEDDLRKEANEKNAKMSDEEKKNFLWKVVGRRGERRIVRTSVNQEGREKDWSRQPDGRMGTRSVNKEKV